MPEYSGSGRHKRRIDGPPWLPDLEQARALARRMLELHPDSGVEVDELANGALACVLEWQERRATSASSRRALALMRSYMFRALVPRRAPLPLSRVKPLRR